MIKIDMKQEVEDIFWQDMKNATTGIIKYLNDNDVAGLLEKDYAVLYKHFYDSDRRVKEDEVKRLLLAKKDAMDKYIDEFGTYGGSKTKQLLEKVFRYDSFSKRKVAYDILQKLDIRVCPYCNRQYTFTVMSSKIRPQFDHYYPKSKYPYLALSLYNLIPCCAICNLSKHESDTKETPILYPYEEEFGEKVVFRMVEKSVRGIRGNKNEFDIEIKVEEKYSAEYKRKIKHEKECFALEELYNEHKDYVGDIIKNHYIYSEQRVQELMCKFPTLFSRKEDVLKTIYMIDYRKESWGKRPLAKLTHDIILQLENKKA